MGHNSYSFFSLPFLVVEFLFFSLNEMVFSDGLPRPMFINCGLPVLGKPYKQERVCTGKDHCTICMDPKTYLSVVLAFLYPSFVIGLLIVLWSTMIRIH